MSIRTRTLLWCLAAVLAPAPAAHGQSPTGGQKKPNVIVIVSDDLGYADLGFQGSKEIPTPHLDGLVCGGVRFSNGYATGPLCGPTRAGLMTGRYQQRHSYDGNPGPKEGLNLKEATLADAFKAGGYRTMAIGKWHLGGLPDYRPLRRGFDEFFGFYGAMHAYVPGEVESSQRMVFERTRKQRAEPKTPDAPRPEAKGFPFPKGGEFGGAETGATPGKIVRGANGEEREVEEKEYLTEAFAREAVGFIGRDAKEPFFLYLAFNASHSPLQPTQKYLDRFPKLEGKRRAYAATTSALDDAVGAIVAKLKALGLEENTVVYYTNDNGGPIDDIAANNAPLSGAKFSLWEGGIRVPSFVAWKGTIAPKRTLDAPVSSLDIFPTVLAAADLPTPEGKRFDGVNLLPAFKGGPTDELKKRTLFWRINQLWAVRSGDWKLTLPERGEKLQLFDLSQDVAEERDLSEKHPEVVERLTAEWKAWDAQNLPARTPLTPPKQPTPEKR